MANERLDIVPAQLRVLVTRRPRYACRRCSGAMVQAHAPERVVPGGLPTEALIAQVIVSKFGDHLPFYRQAEIYKRQGIALDRATLGNWVGRACFHLKPVVEQMRSHLKAADRIFMDETRAPVLDPGRRTTKTGWFWAIVSDDRGHGGAGPPIVMFHYAPGRGGVHAVRLLEGYRGRFLQCDGYQAYDALAAQARPEGSRELVHCWTHVRRRFVKRMETDASPIAEEALRQIAQLYAIEATVRGRAPEIRLAARAELAATIVAAFRPWLGAQLSRIPRSSKLAEDIRYALGIWPGLTRFPRRRAARARHQPGREPDPPDRPDTEERPLRGPRGRRRELGDARLAHRHLQDERREPDRLHRPDTARDPRWPSKEPDRGPHALVLRSAVKPRRVGDREGAYFTHEVAVIARISR